MPRGRLHLSAHRTLLTSQVDRLLNYGRYLVLSNAPYKSHYANGRHTSHSPL